MQFPRIASFKSADSFRRHAETLGIDIPCDEAILKGAASPLSQPVANIAINGKTIGNRFAVQPMEGWDGTTGGAMTEQVLRRWKRFGQSGAKLICGCEAMAVRPDGRANPHQLVISEENLPSLVRLREALFREHQDRYGSVDDLVLGFQLTHSGRFCRPSDNTRHEPRVAYRHPLLDRRFGVTSDRQVFTDAEIEQLIVDFVRAARVAWNAGADFVDIKHCHGYLLHEFLGAFTRPGKYGGSFENRTRILREIVSGIRGDGNPIELGVRLSAFDFVPFKPDADGSCSAQTGVGMPENYSQCLPYRFGFGVNARHPLEPDLMETFEFLELCARLGIKIVNLSAGSPYYNPHLQRPAAYPPTDGYKPPEDPLVGVARQIQAVRQIRARASSQLLLVGSAYSYLQEFLPQVAQAVLRAGWVDIVGIGRMVLSYPEVLVDAIERGEINPKLLCRTFSDCTTAPRNGLISGCYPLDRYYAAGEDAQKLKAIKQLAQHRP
jgi:NADPH2 dehydrogenase